MTLPTKLAVAPFKDMSGYATLARNYLRAILQIDNPQSWVLASTKYDSGSKTALHKSLKLAHDRQISNAVKVNVQILTPNEMRAMPGIKNIGICCWETDRIPKHWVENLNKFDVIVVPCTANATALANSGVIKTIVVLPMPTFEEDYNLKDVKKYSIPGITEDTTVYYNISQWSHKKGIDALIRSYYLAFQKQEDVLLMLKGYVGMTNQRGDSQKLLSAINEIRAAMRLKNYPRIFVSDDVTDEAGIKRYHATGDCYVNFSRGEGWCIPAYDAAMYGKELITVQHTAMLDWVNPQYTFVVESHKDSVHNMPHPDPDLYTANELWYEPNIYSGALAFQEHFSGAKRFKNCEEYRKELLVKNNAVSIGKQLLTAIEWEIV